MKPKLFIILLLLIILPTIFLSIMATRALYNWDIILQKRLQAQAYTAACDVKDRTDTALKSELTRIVSAMKVVHAKGSNPQDIATTAKQLERSGKLIKQIYIFMNPWDFLYPSDSMISSDKAQMLSRLREKISSAESPAIPLCFNIGADSYCFSVVSMQGMYAGYEVAIDELYIFLQKTLRKSADELIIYAESSDLLVMSDKQVKIIGAKNITIEDPFGKEIKPPHETVIAQTRLNAPFDRIIIKAKIKDEEKLRKIATIRRSVYGWVILLLVFGIIVGVIIVWHSVVVEIKQARARSNYVAGISHDLRTPLASMKVLTETLLRGKIKDSNKQKKFLETIFKENERLNQLVERVLFFVRYGQDALVFKLEPNNIAITVNKAVEIMGERLCLSEKSYECNDDIQQLSGLVQQHNFKINDITTIQLNVNIADDLPIVRLDLAAIMQVLLNLLDNAVKYSNVSLEQQSLIKIDLKVGLCIKEILWLKKTWLIITVRDYGIGIEKKTQKKIFERFYRSTRAVNQNVSGVGLGLSLCKHIVKSHGGKITVESSIDEGSTFFVYLPVKAR
jgi:signal transduction histidine kinase